MIPTNGVCQNLTLSVIGHDIMETQMIDSLGYVKTHKNFSLLSSQIDTLQKKLVSIGFLENEASKIERENDSTFLVKIHLKKKYNTIYIYYNKNILDLKLLNLISSQVFSDYFILPIDQVEESLRFINSKISNKGYPFSKLKLSNIEIANEGVLKATLILNLENQIRKINNVTIKGYDKFPKSFLKHYLHIKPGQIFDLNLVKRKTEPLNSLRFAKQIKSPEVLFTKDSTSLYIYIEKTKSNTFDGFLGFGTDEKTNALDFNGYLNLNLVNNLNYGESFSLQYKSTQNSQKLFQADLGMPYFLNTPIGIDLQLHIFKQDSSFNIVNQSVKAHYQINPKHKIYTGIKTVESNNLQNTTSISSISDYKSNYLTFAYLYTNPQYNQLLFPLNSSLHLETGLGKRKNASSTQKQTQININVFKILNFNQTNSLYLRLNGFSLISENYFENELSRFGGINSIRGFDENSIAATSYAFLNSEYRLQLSSNLYIHTIMDVASFENKIIDLNEKLFAYGLGLGVLSNTGLLKLNYANGKSSSQKFKFSNSQVHISFTANF